MARESFLGLSPRFRVLPGSRDTVFRCLLLSRGLFPLQRNPIAASHHSRSCLLRVLLRPCRSCRLRRLAPVAISPVFSTGRARGVHPSELDTARIAVASRRSLPSCDWLTRRHGTERLLSFGGTRLPGPLSGSIAFRLRRMTRWPSGASFEVPCVPDHRRPVVIAAAVRTAVRRGLAPGV
jgi:hypothetical protein